MLPLDILENILEFLASDGLLGNIKELALTSKSFSPVCQKSLYKEIKLKHEDSDKDGMPHPIEAFHSHLAKYPHLGVYVRSIEIVCEENHDEATGFEVLDLLNRVHTFTFGFSLRNLSATDPQSWTNLPAGIKAPVMSFLRQNPLTRLSLICISDLPISLFRDCHRLRRLSLYNIIPLQGGADVAMNKEEAVALESLEIDKWLVKCIEGLILPSSSGLDLSEVTKLTITSRTNEEDPSFHRIMSEPKSLKELKLHLHRNFQDWSCHGTTISRLSSSSIESLKVVRICLDTYSLIPGSDQECEFPTLGGLVPEFSAISGRNAVEEIDLEFSICHQTPLPLSINECNKLDVVLCWIPST
ncbi:hypothetical protein BKA70DRAFT_1564631 [Coprinopsis sp. MPI-PUGE-AT-0042]|nr:hypothetical protein BKA70DRAFT_1564631 [Coprinopsis sp. MPI-PUGE-AT-0042]